MVKFKVDFRGRLTSEMFFLAGSEAEFSESVEKQLVDDRRAEYVKSPEEVPETVVPEVVLPVIPEIGEPMDPPPPKKQRGVRAGSKNAPRTGRRKPGRPRKT